MTGRVPRAKLRVITGGTLDRRLAVLTSEAARQEARLAVGNDGLRVALRYGLTDQIAVVELEAQPYSTRMLQLANALEVGQSCIVSTDASPADFETALREAARSSRAVVPPLEFVDAAAI